MIVIFLLFYPSQPPLKGRCKSHIINYIDKYQAPLLGGWGVTYKEHLGANEYSFFCYQNTEV